MQQLELRIEALERRVEKLEGVTTPELREKAQEILASSYCQSDWREFLAKIVSGQSLTEKQRRFWFAIQKKFAETIVKTNPHPNYEDPIPPPVDNDIPF